MDKGQDNVGSRTGGNGFMDWMHATSRLAWSEASTTRRRGNRKRRSRWWVDHKTNQGTLSDALLLRRRDWFRTNDPYRVNLVGSRKCA